MSVSNILGLRTAIYKVNDLPAAKAFYSEAFRVKPYFDEPFYVGYNVGGFELGLQPDQTLLIERSDNVVAYWGVNDIHSEYQRFLELGATAYEPPTNVGGDIIVATVNDMWGNAIGLIYNPHFELADSR